MTKAIARVETAGDFYSLLIGEGKIAVSMAEALKELMEKYQDLPSRRKVMKDLEHEADDIVHKVHLAVNETFVTPIDREDLKDLASKMDQVIDMLYATVLRLELYKIESADSGMSQLADIVLRSVEKLVEALSIVESREEAERVEALTVEVHKLENLADEVMNREIASLFSNRDPISVIKLKEIYEKLEQATDYCEDVADIIGDIVAKNR